MSNLQTYADSKNSKNNVSCYHNFMDMRERKEIEREKKRDGKAWTLFSRFRFEGELDSLNMYCVQERREQTF